QAYAEIDAWNQQPNNQQIRALALYRWPKLDRWHISGKTGVMEDFREALSQGYRWRGSALPGEPAKPVVKEPPKPKVPPLRAQWLEDRFPSRLNAGQVVT